MSLSSGTLRLYRRRRWSFGCVLHEMLTGTRPFGGGNVSEVLAEVIKSEPDWKALLDATPPGCGRSCAGACRKRTTQSPRHRLTACSMIGSRLMSLNPGATRGVAV